MIVLCRADKRVWIGRPSMPPSRPALNTADGAPKEVGRRTSQLPQELLSEYPSLCETPSPDPLQRTEWNIRDSDATLVLVNSVSLARSRGTQSTLAFARELGRPLLVIDPRSIAAASESARWVAERGKRLVLNVAGPRESEAPGIYAAARQVVDRMLASLADVEAITVR